MISLKKVFLCAACAAAFALALPDVSDAARLGGGRSFGSSSFMSRPAAPSGSYGKSFGSSSTMQRQAAPRAGQSAAAQGGAAAIPRSGGMFGGLFGGLLAGTFLGSMFGGGTAAGTAAGTGSSGGFMNLLLIGLMVWLGIRLFRRFMGGSGISSGRNTERTVRYGEGSRGNSHGGTGEWSALRSESAGSSAASDRPAVSVPAGFDEEEFLRGAKAAYTRMQESWDRRDLEDIALFATDSVMSELRRQAADDPQPGTTELMLVNASLLEVRDEGPVRRVAVYFDVLMREDRSAERPEQVREVWHFVCGRDGSDHWKLDGIQQMA